jgi:hypothetical protein
MDDIKSALPHIEAWAKTMKCARVSYVGRKGWLRAMPEYTQTSVVGEKDI